MVSTKILSDVERGMNTTITIQTNDDVVCNLMSHDYMPCGMSCGMQGTVGCGAPTQAVCTFITVLVLPTQTMLWRAKGYLRSAWPGIHTYTHCYVQD